MYCVINSDVCFELALPMSHYCECYVCMDVFWTEWRHELWMPIAKYFLWSFKWTFKVFYVLSLQLIYNIYSKFVRCRGVVGKIPAFQPGGPGLIPDWVKNFNFYSGSGCVSFVFCPMLSPAVALTSYWPHIQGAPPLNMSSFLVNSILLPLQESVSRAFGL